MGGGATEIPWKFIGGIAAALGAAVGAWLLGVLPAIWVGIAGAAAWLWKLSWYTVPVPLVLFVVLVVFAVRGLPWPAGKTRVSEAQLDETRLSDLEHRVLTYLARADGLQVYFDELVEALSVSRLHLEQACEELMNRHFIRAQNSYIRGDQVYLTPIGRRYVLEHGYTVGPGR